MKSYIFLIITFFTLLLPSPIRAEKTIEFQPDSIPSIFAELKEYRYQRAAYLSRWNEIKKKIDNQIGNRDIDLYYLYQDRNYFHYYQGDVDSVKKYTPIIKDICQRLNYEKGYYRNWYYLCMSIIFSQNDQKEIEEVNKMYNEANSKKSKIGLAFSLNVLGDFYGTEGDYEKAKPYIEQAMQLFEELKYWSEYSTLTANYITILEFMKQLPEAKQTFYHLDSLANAFSDGKPLMKPVTIAMIKDMAANVFTSLQDTSTLKKYMKEIDDLYKEYPNTPRMYLYNTKEKYATIKNDMSTVIAYQDSGAHYYKSVHDMVNLKRMYHNMAFNLYEIGKYKEAFDVMNTYATLGDSLVKADTRQQLNELSTRYNMNKLELEAQKSSLKARNIQFIYACVLIFVLLCTLVIGVKFYLHKLKVNRILQKQTDELKQANERVQQAQIIKTAFIQNMNHEIRTPLNSIVGFSECLSQIQMSPEEIKEISGTIKKNSDNLLKIISDILYIANLDSESETLQCEDISVDACCRTIIHEMSEHTQPGVKLFYTPGNTNLIFYSNEYVIHQIISNLLHNALKFTMNGEVELKYEVDEKEEKLYFYVRDTGPGVSSELKEKIFERFYKVDSFVPGAGLGLALCRILAERIGARIYLDDNYHPGCLFVVEHPLRQSAPERNEE